MSALKAIVLVSAIFPLTLFAVALLLFLFGVLTDAIVLALAHIWSIFQTDDRPAIVAPA